MYLFIAVQRSKFLYLTEKGIHAAGTNSKSSKKETAKDAGISVAVIVSVIGAAIVAIVVYRHLLKKSQTRTPVNDDNLSDDDDNGQVVQHASFDSDQGLIGTQLVYPSGDSDSDDNFFQ